jgi:chemotaxis protein methyltransferase CheR
MLPEAMKRNAASRRLRIWSAGCSTGEEPYCLAMIAAESVATATRWDVKILATDIDSDVIAAASRGVYTLDRLNSVPQERLRRFFQRGVGDNEGSAMARPELRSLITYRTLNLLHNWPMRGPFDVIFCRNVMIYFDQATREKLVGRFGEMLAPGGYLCIGHSESIHAGTAPFKLVGKTIYRRHGGDHAG